jgi:N-glycosylase/DNA lyase
MQTTQTIKITDEDIKMARRVFDTYFKPPKSDEDIFYDLMFCICAPQTTFKNNSKVIEHLKKSDYYGFTSTASYDMPWLKTALKPVRFFNNKAKWVAEAKQKFPQILEVVKAPAMDVWGNSLSYPKRQWLVKNVKGLGMKTASHFLRNLGAPDLAIIDTHILKYLAAEDLEGPLEKVPDKLKYEELEYRLREIAKKERITVAEFDIILWKYYSKTEWKDFVH